MFENRIYRNRHNKDGLVSFDVTVKETNLNIQADKEMRRQAIEAVLQCRNILENYIRHHPGFTDAFSPVPMDETAPGMIREMLAAAESARVGPMAAVAGIIAQQTGTRLLDASNQILVENGGDIFVKSDTPIVFTIYAGDSPFSMSCGIEIDRQETPYGICTSSGTLGHSKSYGKTDAAMVFSDSCALADTMATALGNRVAAPEEIQPAIDWGKTIAGVRGIVIILGENIGIWGPDLKLVRL